MGRASDFGPKVIGSTPIKRNVNHIYEKFVNQTVAKLIISDNVDMINNKTCLTKTKTMIFELKP